MGEEQKGERAEALGFDDERELRSGVTCKQWK